MCVWRRVTCIKIQITACFAALLLSHPCAVQYGLYSTGRPCCCSFACTRSLQHCNDPSHRHVQICVVLQQPFQQQAAVVGSSPLDMLFVFDYHSNRIVQLFLFLLPSLTLCSRACCPCSYFLSAPKKWLEFFLFVSFCFWRFQRRFYAFLLSRL